MTDHTPGPWVIEEDTLGCKTIFGNDGSDVFTCSVGYTNGLTDEDEDAANARLIAAAPEMLAMLEDILSMVHEDGGKPWISASFDPKDVIGLIAKAKGEKP